MEEKNTGTRMVLGQEGVGNQNKKGDMGEVKTDRRVWETMEEMSSSSLYKFHL